MEFESIHIDYSLFTKNDLHKKNFLHFMIEIDRSFRILIL